MNFIQAKLNPMDTAERAQLPPTEFAAVRDSDLSVLIAPYLTIGIVIFVMLLVIRFTKMPKNGDQSHSINFGPTLKRIFPSPTIGKELWHNSSMSVPKSCAGLSSSNTALIYLCHKVWKKRRQKSFLRNITSLQ